MAPVIIVRACRGFRPSAETWLRPRMVGPRTVAHAELIDHVENANSSIVSASQFAHRNCASVLLVRQRQPMYCGVGNKHS